VYNLLHVQSINQMKDAEVHSRVNTHLTGIESACGKVKRKGQTLATRIDEEGI
jgi:hypothetical protein